MASFSGKSKATKGVNIETQSTSTHKISEMPSTAKPTARLLNLPQMELDDSVSSRPTYEKKVIRLMDLLSVRKEISAGSLMVTPSNHIQLLEHATAYQDAFISFDKGLHVKGWKTSQVSSSLRDLLQSFTNVSKFIFEVEWDVVGVDIGSLIIDCVQFYENLSELRIRGCRVNDEAMDTMIDCIASPGMLISMDIRDNLISETTVLRIREKFIEMTDLKYDAHPTAPIGQRTAPITTSSSSNDEIEKLKNLMIKQEQQMIKQEQQMIKQEQQIDQLKSEVDSVKKDNAHLASSTVEIEKLKEQMAKEVDQLKSESNDEVEKLKNLMIEKEQQTTKEMNELKAEVDRLKKDKADTARIPTVSPSAARTTTRPIAKEPATTEQQREFYDAADRGDTDTLQRLWEEVLINVNDKPYGRYTPLMAASYSGHKDAVQFLLDRGANKTLRSDDRNNKTALDFAKEMGHRDIVKMLE